MLTAVHHAVVHTPQIAPSRDSWAQMMSAVRGLPFEAEARLNAAAERILRRRHGYVRAVGDQPDPILDPTPTALDLDQPEGSRGELAKVVRI